MVRADAFLIENVLTNYLSNALHHVRDGGGISGTIRRAGDDRVRISIYNDGDLIPPDDLARIWESFYKVDKARTRAYGGTGIGLSVVAAIMRAHGMPYGVFNRRDGEKTGVEFYIELEQAAPEKEDFRMNEDGIVSFREMADDEEDYKRLAGWLCNPKVREWYGADDFPSPPTVEEVKQTYAVRRLREKETRPCFILIDGEPAGYIQYYPIREHGQADGVYGRRSADRRGRGPGQGMRHQGAAGDDPFSFRAAARPENLDRSGCAQRPGHPMLRKMRIPSLVQNRGIFGHGAGPSGIRDMTSPDAGGCLKSLKRA